MQKEDWKPDKEAKVCDGCSKSFNVFRRRHHCRTCGLVFCADCCSEKVRGISGYGDTAQRICVRCKATTCLTPDTSSRNRRRPSVTPTVTERGGSGSRCSSQEQESLAVFEEYHKGYKYDWSTPTGKSTPRTPDKHRRPTSQGVTPRTLLTPVDSLGEPNPTPPPGSVPILEERRESRLDSGAEGSPDRTPSSASGGAVGMNRENTTLSVNGSFVAGTRDASVSQPRLSSKARVAYDVCFGYHFQSMGLAALALSSALSTGITTPATQHLPPVLGTGHSVADSIRRLDFIGSAVLNASLTHLLYAAYPEHGEEWLSRLRASLLNAEQLVRIGGVDDLWSKVDEGEGLQETAAVKVRIGIVRCVFGAIFLEGGWEALGAAVMAAFTGKPSSPTSSPPASMNRRQPLTARRLTTANAPSRTPRFSKNDSLASTTVIRPTTIGTKSPSDLTIGA
jgi:hypothetical protein